MLGSAREQLTNPSLFAQRQKVFGALEIEPALECMDRGFASPGNLSR